jgi:hypothetical protein
MSCGIVIVDVVERKHRDQTNTQHTRRNLSDDQTDFGEHATPAHFVGWPIEDADDRELVDIFDPPQFLEQRLEAIEIFRTRVSHASIEAGFSRNGKPVTRATALRSSGFAMAVGNVTDSSVAAAIAASSIVASAMARLSAGE